jgi:hypothetical protein
MVKMHREIADALRDLVRSINPQDNDVEEKIQAVGKAIVNVFQNLQRQNSLSRNIEGYVLYACENYMKGGVEFVYFQGERKAKVIFIKFYDLFEFDKNHAGIDIAHMCIPVAQNDALGDYVELDINQLKELLVN